MDVNSSTVVDVVRKVMGDTAIATQQKIGLDSVDLLYASARKAVACG